MLILAKLCQYIPRTYTTGYQPVPPGNLPGGTGSALVRAKTRPDFSAPSAVPVGRLVARVTYVLTRSKQTIVK